MIRVGRAARRYGRRHINDSITPVRFIMMICLAPVSLMILLLAPHRLEAQSMKVQETHRDFKVTTTADDGAGPLHQAIRDAALSA